MSSEAVRLVALSLGEEAFEGPARLAWWEVGQIVVMRRNVHEPLALDVGDGADVISRRQHKLLIQRPANQACT
jgi:hypothetical protein